MIPDMGIVLHDDNKLYKSIQSARLLHTWLVRNGTKLWPKFLYAQKSTKHYTLYFLKDETFGLISSILYSIVTWILTYLVSIQVMK